MLLCEILLRENIPEKSGKEREYPRFFWDILGRRIIWENNLGRRIIWEDRQKENKDNKENNLGRRENIPDFSGIFSLNKIS